MHARDRRSHPRVRLPSAGTLCARTASPGHRPARFDVTNVDISESGALVVGAKDCPVGSHVGLCLRMDDRRVTISRRGVVVRTFPIPHGAGVATAIAFAHGHGSPVDFLPSTLAAASDTDSAAIVSEHPLEILWWAASLPPGIVNIWIGTRATEVLPFVRSVVGPHCRVQTMSAH